VKYNSNQLFQCYFVLNIIESYNRITLLLISLKNLDENIQNSLPDKGYPIKLINGIPQHALVPSYTREMKLVTNGTVKLIGTK
jgi:hypothetical protein